MKGVKNLARNLLILLHLDLTKNIYYDRLTRIILSKHLHPWSNCIDIGCHKGEILDLFLIYAKQGSHYAFEPIPDLYRFLGEKYHGKVKLFPFALSDKKGLSSFQWVKNAPAYSGLKKRKYDIADPVIEEIEVELRVLDDIIPEQEQIHFIKIDVEGAELNVLMGAKRIIKRDKPIILFEFGKGASDFYGVRPDDIFGFFSTEMNMKIFTLKGFLKSKTSLKASEFEKLYDANKEYYFVAASS